MSSKKASKKIEESFDEEEEELEIDLDDLPSYSIADLKKYCIAEGIKVKGTSKNDYIAAIEKYNEPSEEEEVDQSEEHEDEGEEEEEAAEEDAEENDGEDAEEVEEVEEDEFEELNLDLENLEDYPLEKLKAYCECEELVVEKATKQEYIQAILKYNADQEEEEEEVDKVEASVDESILESDGTPSTRKPRRYSFLKNKKSPSPFTTKKPTSARKSMRNDSLAERKPDMASISTLVDASPNRFANRYISEEHQNAFEFAKPSLPSLMGSQFNEDSNWEKSAEDLAEDAERKKIRDERNKRIEQTMAEVTEERQRIVREAELLGEYETVISVENVLKSWGEEGISSFPGIKVSPAKGVPRSILGRVSGASQAPSALSRKISDAKIPEKISDKIAAEKVAKPAEKTAEKLPEKMAEKSVTKSVVEKAAPISVVAEKIAESTEKKKKGPTNTPSKTIKIITPTAGRTARRTAPKKIITT